MRFHFPGRNGVNGASSYGEVVKMVSHNMGLSVVDLQLVSV